MTAAPRCCTGAGPTCRWAGHERIARGPPALGITGAWTSTAGPAAPLVFFRGGYASLAS